jgi:hypothetical protein
VIPTSPEAAANCPHEIYDPISFILHPSIRWAPGSSNPVTKTTAGIRAARFDGGG